jgi:hypothetical protein
MINEKPKNACSLILRDNYRFLYSIKFSYKAAQPDLFILPTKFYLLKIISAARFPLVSSKLVLSACSALHKPTTIFRD